MRRGTVRGESRFSFASVACDGHACHWSGPSFRWTWSASARQSRIVRGFKLDGKIASRHARIAGHESTRTTGALASGCGVLFMGAPFEAVGVSRAVPAEDESVRRDVRQPRGFESVELFA